MIDKVAKNGYMDMNQSSETLLYAPVEGMAIPIEELSDSVLASGSIGKGAAIQPSNGCLFSPITGIITMVYPTNHAIGITNEVGMEILIHIGIKTEKMKREFITITVKAGEQIQAGQVLGFVDLDKLKLYDIGTVVSLFIVNPGFQELVTILKKGKIMAGEPWIQVG